ncbi:MAG: Hsp70 family protein [Bacteroidales bacterium]
MKEKIILGIDLGTTYSAVAYVDEYGEAKIIPNDDNERITPSVVYFENEDNIVVGQGAKDEMEMSPEKVVAFVKREMGKRKEDVRINELTGDHNPYNIYGRMYSPEEISAFILKSLKKDAENYFQGKEVKDAVITVPAYFSDSEKKSTKDAGEMAGFNVLQVINEPTAAAISYGLTKEGNNSQKVMVFDLGGGTFDVTILDIIETNGTKKIDIINTDGDHRLGGKDWDDAIIEFISEKFIDEHGEDPRDNIETLNDLRLKAEKAKKDLSKKDSSRILIQTEENSLRVEITRDDFNEITEGLMSSVETLCNSALIDANLSWDDIDNILLAGGSTRMPMVQELLKKLSGKEIRTDLVNPDECVAMGAAIHATILNIKNNDSFGTLEMKEKLGNVEVSDITSHTIGKIIWDSEANSNKVFSLIKKGSKVPYEGTQTFYTVNENQLGVQQRITEGESEDPDEVIIIQEAFLKFAKELPKDSPIKYTYSLSADGMFTLHAKDETTNKEITIKIERKNNLSSDELIEAKESIHDIKVSS